MEDGSEQQGLLSLIKSFLKRKTHLGNSNDLTEEIHDIIVEIRINEL